MHSPTRSGGLRFVRFSLEEGQLLATYQDRPWINGIDESDNKQVAILAENIESISFSYAGENPDVEPDSDEYIEWLDAIANTMFT